MAALVRSLVDLVLAPICLGCRGAMQPDDARRPVCGRCRSLLAAPPPPLCVRCGAPRLATGRDEARTCPECSEWPPTLRFARAACLYQAPADRLIHALKYHGWHVVASPLGERLAQVRLPDEVEDEARTCVPVPTTVARRRQRGYDQAALLARDLARRTGRVCVDALARKGNSVTQTALQPMARGANVAGGFLAVDDVVAPLRGTHVLLVDDVLTTGATAMECARTLAAAGVRCISLLTFARALVARSGT